MKIYCTRHGQPDTSYYIKNDNRFPAYDVPLTELGKNQALLLGKYLKKIGFKGIIYSSPFRRTLQTASIIAERLGLKVIVLAGIREIRFGNPLRGLNANEIMSEFPLCEAMDMPYPWWTDSKETMDEVCERVNKTIDMVLGDKKGEDVLFVGHGASIYACRAYLGIENMNELGISWNCGLSLLDTETGENYSYDVSFLPNDMLTDNAKTLDDILDGKK